MFVGFLLSFSLEATLPSRETKPWGSFIQWRARIFVNSLFFYFFFFLSEKDFPLYTVAMIHFSVLLDHIVSFHLHVCTYLYIIEGLTPFPPKSMIAGVENDGWGSNTL